MRISDWSSDVCSSDLLARGRRQCGARQASESAGRQEDHRRQGDTGRRREGSAKAGERRCTGRDRLQPRDLWSDRSRSEADAGRYRERSEEHTSELQSLMRISYAVFCLKKKKKKKKHQK